MTAAFEAAREFWVCARHYPANKEDPAVYGVAHTETQEFDRHAGKTVLEYGCGGGADALSYLRRGCDVTFCDIVPANVMTTATRVAAQGAADPPDGRRATATLLTTSAPLPFPDEAFDVVNAHGVLHHILDPISVVDEFFRVLRPGGWCYVMLYTESLAARCEPVVAGLMTTGLSREQAFGAVTDGSGCPHARPYTDEEGRRLLERSGFAVDRVMVYNDGDFRTFRGRKG